MHIGAIDGGESPIESCDPIHNTLLTTLEPNKHPYHVRLIHTEFDPNDPCPVYDFHIAVKPLHHAVEENLICEGHELPPEELTITEKTTKLAYSSAFSDDIIKEFADEDGRFHYDMLIELPHTDFFFDVELKTDFLTGNFHMYLYAWDERTEDWEQVALSHWFNENAFEDVSVDADFMMSTKLGDKTMI